MFETYSSKEREDLWVAKGFSTSNDGHRAPRYHKISTLQAVVVLAEQLCEAKVKRKASQKRLFVVQVVMMVLLESWSIAV